MGIIRCAECGGIIMGEFEYTGDKHCKCNETISNLSDVFIDWNVMSLDQMVEYLRNKYAVSSTGDAKCIYHLIEFYDEHKNKII